MAHDISAGLSPAYTPAAGRKFGLTVGAALLVFGGIAWWRDHPTARLVLFTLGGVLILAALVMPAALGPVDRAWMKLAHLISRVTTPLFLGIIYYLVMTPVGLLRRAFGKNSLVHAPGAQGVWVSRDASPRSSLERLF